MAKARMKMDDYTAKALQHRMADAVSKAGGKDVLTGPVIEAAYAVCKGRDVAGMRELGGYSAVISSVIGPAPSTTVNQLGFVNEPQWYVWRFLMDNVGEMREAVQIKMAAE